MFAVLVCFISGLLTCCDFVYFAGRGGGGVRIWELGPWVLVRGV